MSKVAIVFHSGYGHTKVMAERVEKDKLAAGLTISGSPSGNKLNTLQSLMIFAMQHGMIWVGNAEMPYNEQGINRLASFSGVMAQAGQVAPEVEPKRARPAERRSPGTSGGPRRPPLDEGRLETLP